MSRQRGECDPAQSLQCSLLRPWAKTEIRHAVFRKGLPAPAGLTQGPEEGPGGGMTEPRSPSCQVKWSSDNVQARADRPELWTQSKEHWPGSQARALILMLPGGFCSLILSLLWASAFPRPREPSQGRCPASPRLVVIPKDILPWGHSQRKQKALISPCT